MSISNHIVDLINLQKAPIDVANTVKNSEGVERENIFKYDDDKNKF